MPARKRTRKSAKAAPVEVVEETVESEEQEEEEEEEEEAQSEEEQEDGSLHKLQFNQVISWRAGKAIPVAHLLQRLEELGSELRMLDQEDIDRSSLTKVSQELADGHLLGHRDKGIRAWTACCVVDILRLCAPNAPFTVNQLKDIFTLIVTSIIPALADPSNAYNDQHIYVLSSLAEVKSIVLLTDVHAPDTLILPLFSSCFDIVSGSSKASTGEDLAKNVEYDMTRLLAPIIDEAPSLAPEVIDVIVAQFLRVDPRAIDQSLATSTGKGKKGATGVVDAKQGTLLLKDYPPAYNMAKAICNACPEKLTSYISQYFNNVILDASGPSGINGLKNRRNSLDDSEDEGENIKDLNKAHRLIRELWRACPDVLQNVIPQLEAELSADSISLRLLATQTIGDLAAGIGVAGPPPDPSMDPAAYPRPSLNDAESPSHMNALLTPLSPKPFSVSHSSAYESFLSRRQDKSASVRASWATAIGRILLTSAGGTGLNTAESNDLIAGLTRALGDADEKVRIAAVEILGKFNYKDVIKKLGSDGGLSKPGSLLSVLAERVKDRKHSVREQAMNVLARMWAVASGDVEANNEEVMNVLKDAPSKIFDAYYTNDLDLQVLLDHVIYEMLLPLTYPPIKAKQAKGQSQKSKAIKGSQDDDVDPDSIRARRILTLVNGLDERSKNVFFAFQSRQVKMRAFIDFYLTACEEYNMHDRRSYHLIRFTMASASDYRIVARAIRELSNRISSSTSATTTMLESLLPLIYRSSSLIFNRSHIPWIMKISRTDEHGLGNIAHEILRETSTQNPEVLETHVQEMCKDLESQAPNAQNSDDPGVEEILKACAGFAKKLPAKLPTHKQFQVALTNYAMYSSSPIAAKCAVSIIMATSDKKEMYARDLIKKSVQKFTYGSSHFLTKLAALSQLTLLASKEVDREEDAILSIATDQILFKNRNPKEKSGYSWSDEADEELQAKEWALKILVNRVRSREDSDDDEDFRQYADSVYAILNTLVEKQGELSKTEDTPPSQKSRLRLMAAKLIVKLCASKTAFDRMLTPQNFNAIALVTQDPLLEFKKPNLNPRWYIITFLVAFEPNGNLYDSTLTWIRSRASFFSRRPSSSAAGQDQQSSQTTMEALFARLLSVLAHHPDYPPESSDEATTVEDLVDFTRYILFYLSAVANENNLSLIFHIAQRVKQAQDAISDPELSPIMSARLHTLSDLSQATIRRFSECYSQQHKIGGSGSSGVANILQTFPGKMRLPSSLFANIPSHEEAQSTAEKNFLPEEVEDRLDRVVRRFMKPKTTNASSAAGKKRKIEYKPNAKPAADDDDNDAYENGGSSKKQRKEKKQTSSRTVPIRRKSTGGSHSKEPKRKKKKDGEDWGSDADEEVKSTSATARRRSGRGTKNMNVSYAEGDSDEDDKEMQAWDEREEQQVEVPSSETEDNSDNDSDEENNLPQVPEDADMSDVPQDLSTPEVSSSPAPEPSSPIPETRKPKRGRAAKSAPTAVKSTPGRPKRKAKA
ncbi:sister chromatid cohesion and DNA repair protein BimD [Nannizzia gypsea CBS 118893]|uniref:Sister chromatid cohesion and DNA repair protein BimD n=1 Tax=Arthroderma gypseum (strain ATCC MYA-4604 / CBS 118893) TaxID=535722 RepID=E4V427_ARTGP|nr:sister chromatid cohesion and DNA repair protein BimD [Nannizzia gypsea CBS 118893]EFR04751.1 sister chromatid cohesion and DNA repair protein BimD [Nannizzia gypsea CBS 118893]